jgi:recombination protein RecT
MTAAPEYRPVAKKADGVGSLLKVLTPEIQRALPQGMDADRIARLFFTEVRKSRNAKAAGTAQHSLDECTAESITGALLTSSALGLEPGINGECYLIPYRDNKRRVVECQFIMGYQGIVKLFWQHPRAARIDAQTVYSSDQFTYSKGLRPTLEHIPVEDNEAVPTHYYGIVEVTGAQPLWDVFTAGQVKLLRRGKVGSSGNIPDPMRWMERKTALKQVLKLAPKTTRLDLALTADEQTGRELVHSRGIELPAAVEPTPDYIDGEYDDPTPQPTPEPQP